MSVTSLDPNIGKEWFLFYDSGFSAGFDSKEEAELVQLAGSYEDGVDSVLILATPEQVSYRYELHAAAARMWVLAGAMPWDKNLCHVAQVLEFDCQCEDYYMGLDGLSCGACPGRMLGNCHLCGKDVPWNRDSPCKTTCPMAHTDECQHCRLVLC